MNAKRIVNSIKVRGLKGSIQRAKNGKPKTGIIDFWGFIMKLIKMMKNIL